MEEESLAENVQNLLFLVSKLKLTSMTPIF